MTLRRCAASVVLSLILLAPTVASSWGSKGHLAVAQLAETLLLPDTQNKIKELLGPTGHLQDVALWGDDIKELRPETAPWHYLNLPTGKKHFYVARDCPSPPGCVVSAAQQFASVLANPEMHREAKQEALRWVVHLVADLHQPMHAGNATDRGGTEVTVQYLGAETTLHWLWDEKILDHQYARVEDLIARLTASLTAGNQQGWATGEPESWANEARRHAVETAYVPTNTILDEQYAARALSVSGEQLAKAAVRLAWVLNRTLGGR